MEALKIFLRIAKFLGKVVLGLLVMLITVLALLHLPPVQKQIARKLSDYLSSKIEARVNIRSVTFSMLGNVAIDDLTVWDRDGNQIFSAHKIEVRSNVFDLVTGELIFDEVHLGGIDGKLIQSKEGLNIQFIIDAFKPRESAAATESTPLDLQFKKVVFENIVFEFTSEVDSVSIAAQLGMFTSHGFEFHSNPGKIKADQVILQHTVVNAVIRSYADTINTTVASKDNELIDLDFGSGLIFEIKAFELTDDEFSIHRNLVTEAPKFDPFNFTLRNIELSLSDILIREDTLAAGMQSLSAQLPGFALTQAMADIQLNRNQLTLSGLHLVSGTDELRADITAPYDLNSTKGTDYAQIKLDAQINPGDFAYFLSDSIMNQFNWGNTALAMEGDYIMGKGKLKMLNLKTGNSQLHAEGTVGDVLSVDSMNWRDFVVTASIGPDFRNTLTPFLRNVNVPPFIALQLNTSGQLKNIFVDGKVLTAWGDIKVMGKVTPSSGNVGLDLNVIGEKVDLGEWMSQSWLGPANLSVAANGFIGDNTNVEINGLINEVEMLDQSIHDIAFQTHTRQDSTMVTVSITDPNYRSEISSGISFSGPLMISNNILFDDFKLGNLLQMDSALSISGNIKSKIIVDSPSMEGYVEGDSILLTNQSERYSLDTLIFHAAISPTASDITYFADHAQAGVVSNFDLRDLPEVIQTWSGNILKSSSDNIHPRMVRTASFNIDLENANLLRLFGMDVDDFSALMIKGEFNEQKKSVSLDAAAGEFKGYGIWLDTLYTNLVTRRDSIGGSMIATNLYYDSVQLGNLDFEIKTRQDTATSSLLLSRDTVTLLGLQTRILPADGGAFVHVDRLTAFNNDYSVDPENSVHVGNENLVLNHFKISRDSMQISLEGDLNVFDISFSNVDLTTLNYLISPDTTLIDNGHLTGNLSYSRDRQLDLRANINSLSIYKSNPLTINASAVSEGNEVPFEFLLTNANNRIDLKGKYFSDRSDVDAVLLLDVNNPELFEFLVSGVIEEMNGSIKGKASISGPLKEPALKGSLRFVDLGLTTVNPELTFNVRDDSIALENNALLFNQFSLYDRENHSLVINGNITLKDYQSLMYDLRITGDQYTLIHNPDSTSGKLRGQLVIDSDIKLKGSAKNTNIEAKLNIKTATDLTIVNSKSDIELLKTEGIIDFVDPALLLDSIATASSADFYDSLIASLPDFNLNSTISIEDNATFRVIIDEQSGDYIKASGGANLELGYDRTGNLRLAGNYTITKGVYRLSFYDLVKKNFNLVRGSSINWGGSPESGELNIKAVRTVESNSIGLIGHEIGENEKSIYKRSLDYEVGINIKGTIERPVVSFSLDLPQKDRTSYPVLANKLDRLRQPEYESELNKQVFGLLVLGGFLPETSGSDINSNLIATTALSNSVNSLLASQLNRFASQYIKGVNIDVGIQSFSDYSAPGGKTQTAMDFRVTKSMMDDRLSFEIGGDFDINQDQSGANTGSKNYRGDIAIIYDLTGNGDKQLKLFNNETYDIIYQEIRNTGVSLIFIR
ncbi:MAG TPA: translocation/assembly module TamB domain-containing protein, partial [Cyclobacteriaceae bacterium]|nr:translocation/assembly module TamB domain-containing protein [Cyclobacteriaceae bacterium]